ncbi:hypothetical protein BpHYR1_038350 [Brachionus plicatilis]|uniref:Uncharacterized protein n=1 Tax=Brachionus plicatilis TaxID=10195 RepID=A0A3M7RDE4_BRAPC|nr:hypothetical protein BpHYR1_038350 [Brachionus plicatilis]
MQEQDIYHVYHNLSLKGSIHLTVAQLYKKDRIKMGKKSKGLDLIFLMRPRVCCLKKKKLQNFKVKKLIIVY